MYNLYQKIYRLWKTIGLDRFWGDLFDVRFYLIYLLKKNTKENIIDLGCGPGVISFFADASLKIGIDHSFEALRKAKNLIPEMELIQASMFDLPIKKNCIKTVLSAHVIQATPKDQRMKVYNEIERVSSDRGEIYMTWANLKSKHYDQEKIKNSKFSDFNYEELIKFFENNYEVNIKGYGPYSKKIMFPLKLIYKIPEQIVDILKIEECIQSILLSKKFLHEGRGCIMICKKKIV